MLKKPSSRNKAASVSALHRSSRRAIQTVFFRRLGYTEEDWKLLEDDLRAQHITADAEELEPTRYGRKFIIRAPLLGPAGTRAMVASLWVIRSEEIVPRLVTAYPGGE